LPRIRLWSRPALDVEDRLFRALGVLRVVVLVNAVALNAYRADNFDHPTAGVVCVLVMIGWTAYVTYAYADPDRRRPWLLGADLAVAIGLLVASPLVKGGDFQATIPGFWVMAALLAWAIRYYWRGGMFAGACLVVTDVSVRAELTQTTYGNAFLLLVGGPVVGFMSESLHLMAQERDAAQREALAEAERARLARVVHDGVLQVLALVQRRGTEIGGDATELARLAGEQEAALRTMIRSQDSLAPDTGEGTLDLASRLGRLALRPSVQVATPGTAVDLPAATVAEIVAVVAACLDNVSVHVGDDAPAWVLLEALDDRVVISVRDEGPGIPEGRLEEAAAEGRIGVSESIRGRIADLGGTAELSTGSFGTEWEFVVPT
jgi:signal transduction histidine kinase